MPVYVPHPSGIFRRVQGAKRRDLPVIMQSVSRGALILIGTLAMDAFSKHHNRLSFFGIFVKLFNPLDFNSDTGLSTSDIRLH